MSVRGHLTLALVSLGVLPSALFAALFWIALAERLEAQAVDVARAMLRSGSSIAGERAIEGPRRDLPSILLLAGDAGDADRARSVLRDTAAPRPEYLALALLDESGRVIAAYPEEALAAGSLHVPRPGETRLGVAAFSPPFDSGELGSVVIEASYSNGRRTAVAFINLEWLSGRLYLSAGSRGDSLGIVARDGRYVASSDPSRMRAGERVEPSILSGETTRAADRGREYLVTSEPVPGSEWRAVYFRSRAEALEPLREFTLRMAMLALLTLGASALIAYQAWLQVSRPLLDLVRDIDGIAKGRYDERVPLDFRYEYREIAAAINAMAESIEVRGRELKRSEARYRLMFERNGVPALLLGADDASIRDANPAALAYYGYSRPEMTALGAPDIDADSRTAADYAGTPGIATRHRLRSGEIRFVAVFSSPLEIDGEALLYSLVFDVTERKVAEERNVAALEEKTLLLREVYHRVKNNLQIISSLLTMQSAASAAEPVVSALQGAQDRVLAMSLAHELVYQMPDLTLVDAGDYADSLLSYLADAYRVPRDRVSTSFAPLTLDLDQAVPFGLIFTEMASNAFKYGLPAASTGTVRVSIALSRGEGPKEALLVVEDDGPGMSPSAGRADTLGLSLISGLAEQLRGGAAWTESPSGGTRVELRFRVSRS
ncbi:MAG: PAS domain S-box protein [Spirochaetes bacterium]|nr:PAS domain S-box protein [Spirochaetota bacterium]MBU1079486.1 PAS domain S-box protein [Spirochaetota bacterium]